MRAWRKGAGKQRKERKRWNSEMGGTAAESSSGEPGDRRTGKNCLHTAELSEQKLYINK